MNPRLRAIATVKRQAQLIRGLKAALIRERQARDTRSAFLVDLTRRLERAEQAVLRLENQADTMANRMKIR